MKESLQKEIEKICREVFSTEAKVELTRPEEKFGDFSTNIALQMARQAGKNPRELADELARVIEERLDGKVENAEVAGPGFINLRLKDEYLRDSLNTKPQATLSGKTMVAEYSDPNPFKVLHAGHLYTSVVGDAIGNLLEQAGATVHRVNFGGDVGLHVGKTMWAILKELGGENPDGLNAVEPTRRSEWMAESYVRGTRAYEEDQAAKAEIVELNKRVYALHDEGDRESPFARIYWTCRQWSYDYFNDFYARIGSRFEKYYPESETAPVGLKTVREHIGTVYRQSDGAVVFDGEQYGLHTRVFINSEGLPTYEAKDVGLIMLKQRDYRPDGSVIITGNEQEQYLAVVLKSVEQFAPELVQATRHLTHGIVKLKGGVKMSSRKGNFLRAVDVLDAAASANKELTGQDSADTVLGAVKYAFLKNRMGGDIIYDPVESVSLEGNSGPYLQYAHARARSILAKVQETPGLSEEPGFEPGERTLVRKISEYPETVDKAVAELMPHHICTFLYELAQTFNRFYEHNRVLGDTRQDVRLGLVSAYADTLKAGLTILGIASPDKM